MHGQGAIISVRLTDTRGLIVVSYMTLNSLLRSFFVSHCENYITLKLKWNGYADRSALLIGHNIEIKVPFANVYLEENVVVAVKER